jgi:hypothetical protein
VVDIDTWRKKSPVAAWVAFIALLTSSGYGVLDAGLELKAMFTEPPPAIADIRTADFQHPRLVEVYAELVNPAGFARTFRSVGVVCATHSGKEIMLNALNNMPRELSVIPDLQLSPLDVGAGSALPVRLAFVRDPQFEMNQQCRSIAIFWVGSDGYLGQGEAVEIPKGAVTFTSTQYGTR